MQAMCMPIGSETGHHRGQERVFNDVQLLPTTQEAMQDRYMLRVSWLGDSKHT